VSAVPAQRRPIPPAVRRRRFLSTVANHSILIVLAAVFLFPIFFVVLTSLMTDAQANTNDLWPKPFQWSNFVRVFDVSDLGTYVWNSVRIALVSMVGTVLATIPVAYALSRMRWRGRQAVFVIILATLMLPFQVTVVPLYVTFVRLPDILDQYLPFLGAMPIIGGEWIPSLKPLIIPAFFGDAFSIFLLRQFFMTIPEELTDAARVDGASEWQIMTRVIVPLAKPAIAAVALFHFLWSWNDFFGPLLYLIDDPRLWTVPIGLSEFETLHHVEWNLLMAACVLFMLPVIVLFFMAQKVFIEGVTLTGVKG
jgi:multiple sugar transport system permease protein